MKKIVVSSFLVSLLAVVWCAQAMEIPVQQGQDAEEKGAPEIELLISDSAVLGSAAADSISLGKANVDHDAQLGITWASMRATLSQADRKQLEEHHTSEQLAAVFATLPESAKNSSDFRQAFLLALIKHDKARAADAAAKNKRDYDETDTCIKSFLHTFSLGSIAVVIILCGAVRIQCGN